MQGMLDAWSIIRLHDRGLARAGWPAPPPQGLPGAWRWVAANHHCNCLIWQEEDRTLQAGATAADIAASKRLVDSIHQRRNEAVEAMDEALLAELAHVRLRAGARLSSETPGAMVDRLSILALMIHHMRIRAHKMAPRADMPLCEAKLDRLLAQRRDLAACLDRLLHEARAGEACFKVYRQFGMVAGPPLHPACS